MREDKAAKKSFNKSKLETSYFRQVDVFLNLPVIRFLCLNRTGNFKEIK